MRFPDVYVLPRSPHEKRLNTKLSMLTHNAQTGASWPRFAAPALFPAMPMMEGHSSVQLPGIRRRTKTFCKSSCQPRPKAALGKGSFLSPPVPPLLYDQIKHNPVRRQSLLVGRKPWGPRVRSVSRFIHCAPDLRGAGHTILAFSNEGL